MILGRKPLAKLNPHCWSVRYESQRGDRLVAIKNLIFKKSNIDEFESVCVLYRDDLFARKDYGWCESKKEWLQRYYLNILKNMAEFYADEGLYQDSTDKLLTAAGIAPYDEEILRSLLKVYDAQKNRE